MSVKYRIDLINQKFEVARLTAKVTYDESCRLANDEYYRQMKPFADARYRAVLAAEKESIDSEREARKERETQLEALGEASKGVRGE